MNAPRLIRFCMLAALIAVMGSAHQASAADANAQLDVYLVKAGDGSGGVDKSLRPFASTLQRLFRFQSYALEGKRTVRLTVPGESSVNLTQGQQLTVKASEVQGPGLKAEVEWKRGGKRLLHTRINLRPGNPAVLGGPRSEDGTWLLILQQR